MVGNFGRKAPSLEKHDVGSVHLWNDGLGIFLELADMKEKILTILVVGPAENVLKLTAHARKDDNNEITMFEPKFDELRPNLERGYFINLKNISHILENDLLVKISTFTGDLEAKFYGDKEYKNEVYTNTFHHMGDSLYRFSKEHRAEDNITDALYFKIRSNDKHSTFVISAMTKLEKLIRLAGEIAELSEIKYK